MVCARSTISLNADVRNRFLLTTLEDNDWQWLTTPELDRCRTASFIFGIPQLRGNFWYGGQLQHISVTSTCRFLERFEKNWLALV